MRLLPLALAISILGAHPALAQPAGGDLPPGYWSEARARSVLDTTQDLRLAPDLSVLRPGERVAVAKLLEVGRILQRVFEGSRHHQALASLRALERLHAQRPTSRTRALLDVYRLFQGPIASTPENTREPFLPVDPVAPGKNVYPWGIAKDEVERYLAAHPGSRGSLLDLRSVVRRADAASLQRDKAALARHPVIDTLHPGLRARLAALRPGASLYAVPYSVAYADDMVRVHALLHEAADAVEPEDVELARYLRNRGRDLLSDDYESGDASWVTGRFAHLNAQIGSYETYDDELFGVKAFHAVSILLRDEKASASLRTAIQGLQAIEDALPYERHKKVKEDIPVGVYDVVADFGQARGTNTATILPNEAWLARKYGRTILLRANIMKHPDIYEDARATWSAAVAPSFAGDLAIDGDFQRTLWHEVGHYLGADATRDGRDLDAALQENASAFEEMKADLVSLFAVPALRARGYYDDAAVRSVYAAGIRRALQVVRPRRDQPYQTMELMQMNFFLEHGLLSFDPAVGTLDVHYDRYPQVVADLLKEVLAVQDAGDKAASDRFVERWTRWEPQLHEVIAARMRAQQKHRFRSVHYAALGE